MELKQVIAGILAEEEWACRALLDMYGDRIFRVACGILKDRQLAEDTVQEVFLKVFQKIHQYKPQRSFYAWIYKITVNHCRNKMRGWSFKKLFFVDIFQDRLEVNHDGPEELVLQEERGQMLLTQVMSLKTIYREVLLLFYYEDLSIKEICEALHLNENTVKTRLNRGRQILKENLEREGVFPHVFFKV